MNRSTIQEPDLDKLLKQALKDDLPLEAEARMNRQFVRFKGTLDRAEQLPEPDEWLWMRGPFRKGILAFASAAMMILGFVMQLSGSQSALAYSIEKLKVIVTISIGLNRASFMDCTVLKTGANDEQTSYRVRWRTADDARVDMAAADGAQTLWISNETVSIARSEGSGVHSMPISTVTPGPVWQPAMEFISPKILAKHMEDHYGLMQKVGRSKAGMNEFLIVGREGQQDVEIAVDAITYLPKVLKKYAHDLNRTNGGRNCIMEVRFLWNRPISADLFSPETPAAGQ